MAKIKYDVEDVEVGERTYEQPKPGLYEAKISEANPRQDDGKNDIEVIVEITEKGDYQGAKLWSYVHLGEASRWKLRELTDSVGLPSAGTLDTDKLIGKKIRIKVNAGSYEGEYKARLQRFLPLEDGNEDGTTTGGEDYSSWSNEDLKDEVEARDLEVEGRKTKDKMIAALEADDASNGAAPLPDDEAASAAAGEDYSEWSLDELKEEAEKRGILGNIGGRKTEAKIIEALEADDAGPAGGGAAEPEEDPEDDYDDWELDELVSEAKDRELEIKGRKTKDKVIEALRADDALPFN